MIAKEFERWKPNMDDKYLDYLQFNIVLVKLGMISTIIPEKLYESSPERHVKTMTNIDKATTQCGNRKVVAQLWGMLSGEHVVNRGNAR